MPNASLGNLRDNLLAKKENPNDKYYNLWDISKQLEAIHKLNLIHGNFHSGNLLCAAHDSIMICDFGLCRPDNENDMSGALPYIAPEVLHGEPYTKAADIYSFGILMWEMISGVSAIDNISDYMEFMQDICKDVRPKAIEGTVPEYVKLMKKCWNEDPKKRPSANKLSDSFYKWNKEYPIEKDDKKRNSIHGNYKLFI
jgi:serine/threonine protein kinase